MFGLLGRSPTELRYCFDALDVTASCRRLLKGGSLREGVGSGLPLIGDLADDGNRFDALDVARRAGGCDREGV